jgi:predicted nucleic acid-binding protein
MPELLWDASALVKRYAVEAGSDTVAALFAFIPPSSMVATFWSYVETFASLLRKHNRGEISAATWQSSATLLRLETLSSPDFRLLTVGDADVLGGVPYLQQHNLNTNDAALLTTYLRYSHSQPPGNPTRVLVAADQRLVRAAAAEGLTTLNPETVAAADIPALLATW